MMKRIAPYQEMSSLDNYRNLAEELFTILDFYRFAVSLAAHKDIYYGHGTDNPMDEFAFLILESLGLPYDYPSEKWLARLTKTERLLLSQQLYARIEQHIPAPYLVNKAYFCGIPFYVNEAVLIPRSPIAELIEKHFAPWVDEYAVTQILDLCTGSGCIAAAMSFAFPEAMVDAIDIDASALQVAQKNITDLGLEESVCLIQSDGFDALNAEFYDIIVSNPPYVGAAEMQTLPSEYLHEPQIALQAKQNGLDLVHRILQQASKHLKPHGILVVEVGNSYLELIKAYPELPFIWLDFEHGGHGVFLLEAKDLPKWS